MSIFFIVIIASIARAAAAVLCACLLDLRRSAEAQGRLDFTAEVESACTGAPMVTCLLRLAHPFDRYRQTVRFGQALRIFRPCCIHVDCSR
jgi:hypothetical protein